MRAEVVAQGPDGTRTIGLDELFDGPFVTTLAPTEIITEVRVPDPGPNAGGTYLKLERKVGDFATVGVAVHLSMDDGKVAKAGIALTAVGPTNLRADRGRGGAGRFRADRRGDRRGGPAGRRGRPAVQRHPGQRRLQADRGPGVHRAGPADRPGGAR